MYGIVPINGESRVYNWQIVRWHGMQIPELQANVEVKLGTGQNTTEIAMQRHKIMSEAEKEKKLLEL